MKNTFYVASLFVCAFIGAGFSSGEEIKAFFPSGYGPSGVIFSACLLIFTPLLLTELCFSLNVFSYKEFLSVSLKKFSLFLYNISNFFLLCMFATMCVGAANIIKGLFNINKFASALIFILVNLIILKFNIKGVFYSSLVLAPVLIFSMLYLLLNQTIETSFFPSIYKGGLYISYNFLSIVPSLIVAINKVKNKKEAMWGVFLGSVFISILIIFCFNLFSFKDVSGITMPLLVLSKDISYSFYLYYSFVLILAMLTTSLSSAIGFLEDKKNPFKVFLLISAALLFVFVPFSVLIDKLYSLFGILGIVLIIGIFRKWLV